MKVLVTAFGETDQVIASGDLDTRWRAGRAYPVEPAIFTATGHGIIVSVEAYVPDLDMYIDLPLPMTGEPVSPGARVQFEFPRGVLSVHPS